MQGDLWVWDQEELHKEVLSQKKKRLLALINLILWKPKATKKYNNNPIEEIMAYGLSYPYPLF